MSPVGVDNTSSSYVNCKAYVHNQICLPYCAQVEVVLQYSLPLTLYVKGCTSHYRCVFPQNEDPGTGVMAKGRPHCNPPGCEGARQRIGAINKQGPKHFHVE